MQITILIYITNLSSTPQHVSDSTITITRLYFQYTQLRTKAYPLIYNCTQITTISDSNHLILSTHKFEQDHEIRIHQEYIKIKRRHFTRF